MGRSLVLFPLMYVCSVLASCSSKSTIVSTDNFFESPFSLNILSENYDGRTLIVQGAVFSELDRSLSDVVVRFITLSEGESVSRVEMPLLELIYGDTAFFPLSGKGQLELSGGESVRFQISSSGQDITNYQIELLWGRS
jgi:hypothetical protein